ncbi:copper resistance CopC family protein [Nakamurella endophytica]|uniref:CopC domain-containing protein n=1 Tax=Nakamurella endophytica TaxID=1748367 RepID=A0A917T4R7_9ACTN|nr:copper resistance CopC family protein [Nakamurella endophytica]GGM10438.1 hypothetical protein GCM10011594_32920 [Nakamurella endophytica]
MRPSAAAQRPHRRAAATVARLVAVVAAVLATTVVAAGPASAHDVLISSSPAANSTLATPPSTVTFTFDQPVQNFEPVVSLIGPDGQQHRSGPVQVDGNVVSSAVSGGPAGQWVAAYRVVSADGHPVTGEVRFTVTTGSTAGPAGSGGATAATDPIASASGTTGSAGATTGPAGSAAPSAAASSGLSAWLWIGLAVAVVLLGAAVVVLVRGPRRRTGAAGS